MGISSSSEACFRISPSTVRYVDGGGLLVMPDSGEFSPAINTVVDSGIVIVVVAIVFGLGYRLVVSISAMLVSRKI